MWATHEKTRSLFFWGGGLGGLAGGWGGVGGAAMRNCSHLGSRLDLVLADETLLDPRRAQGAGGNVAARPEQGVSLHVRAHHALLQRLHVAVQGRAAGAYLAAGSVERRVGGLKNKREAGTKREEKSLNATALPASLLSKMQ